MKQPKRSMRAKHPVERKPEVAAFADQRALRVGPAIEETQLLEHRFGEQLRGLRGGEAAVPAVQNE